MNQYRYQSKELAGIGLIHKLPKVYVLATDRFEFIKIGQTKSLKQRMNNIQSGCPHKLFLWLAMPTPIPEKLEAILHKNMKHCHHRGEWFCPSEKDLDFLLDFVTLTNKNLKEVANALL